ncbi:MAG: hypothetical protein PQJ44_06870 [Sphaerochaetaceae bacterium]|nr:hypothetical protein [Sphaerochaetaceae bacterium]
MSEEQIIEEKEETKQPETENTEAPEERNWKAFREERKRDREARLKAEQEAERRKKEAEALKQAMDAILDKKTTGSHEEYHEQSLSDQDKIRIEMEKLLDERDKRNEQRRIEEERREMPRRLRQEYPDFDNVVTEENLDYLDYKYPHIAKAYYHMPDSPEKWAAVYKAVKQFVPTSEKDNKKAEQNMNKPRSMASGIANSGDSPPVKLDDARKQANWERMQSIVKTVR